MYDSRCLINNHIFSFPLSLENRSALGGCTQGEQAGGLQTRGRFLATASSSLHRGLFLPPCHGFSRIFPCWIFLAVTDLATDLTVWAGLPCRWMFRLAGLDWGPGCMGDLLILSASVSVSQFLIDRGPCQFRFTTHGLLNLGLLFVIIKLWRAWVEGLFLPWDFSFPLSWICMLGHIDTFLNGGRGNSTMQISTPDWRQKVSKCWCIQSASQQDNERAYDK